MPAKFERCVQHIKDKGQADGVNPWAVCHASIGETDDDALDNIIKEHHNPMDIAWGRKLPDSETVAVSGDLSAIDIGGQRKKIEEAFTTMYVRLMRNDAISQKVRKWNNW